MQILSNYFDLLFIFTRDRLGCLRGNDGSACEELNYNDCGTIG